jgi:calcium-dependent protein kinase
MHAGIHIQSPQAWHDAFEAQELDLSSDPWPSVSSSAKDLLQALLRKDPVRRPTAAQATRYAWLQEQALEMVETLPSPAVIGALMAENKVRRLGKRPPALSDVARMTDLARVSL